MTNAFEDAIRSGSIYLGEYGDYYHVGKDAAEHLLAPDYQCWPENMYGDDHWRDVQLDLIRYADGRMRLNAPVALYLAKKMRTLDILPLMTARDLEDNARWLSNVFEAAANLIRERAHGK